MTRRRRNKDQVRMEHVRDRILIIVDVGKEMLYEAARFDRKGEDLPSRIPDWSEVPIRMNIKLSLRKSGGWFFKAGGKQHGEGPKKPVLNVDGKVLRTMGFVFGTIMNLGEDEVVFGRPPDLARVLTQYIVGRCSNYVKA
ncbi:hypothetical protein GJ744_008159 [Endocarpon pusillum]|uniref:Uncharacterized protein n=1 Tax=Endocarpon pusillum TaxID=364733 RepID=A0A8H7AHK9_9EURO|nr:hypothetical protein GJ744_008159 [Endocarpon pusillum]